MTTALSSKIIISVDSRYEEKFSNPMAKLYLFSYGIRIENKSEGAIQVLRRFWKITDSNTHEREVKGEGVIGEKPIIKAGESYTYRSSCDFTTDMGKMSGQYEMRNLENDVLFNVDIPEFSLIVPYKLN